MNKPRVLILSLILIPAILLSTTPYLWDDAVISYRFALNFLNGYGLAAYPGGVPVEGYSNPTLVFATASIATVTGHSITNIMRVGLWINTLAFALCCFLLLKWGRKDWTWIGAFALAGYYPAHLYRASGLETWLYTLLVIAAVYAFSTSRGKAGLMFSLLAALSRPEGIGLALWLAGVYVLPELPKMRLRRIWLSVRFLIAPFCVFLLWRFWYFGHWVSCTSMAKTHLADRGVFSGAGIIYLYNALSASPVLTALVILTVVRFLHEKQAARFEITAVAFQIFFIIVVGGDEWYFERYRFIVPILPFLFRSLAVIREVLPHYAKKSATVSSICMVIIAIFTPIVRPYFSDNSMAVPWVYEAYHVRKTENVDGFINPKPWHDANFSAYLAENVTNSGAGLTLNSCQGGALPLFWQGIYEDNVGLMDHRYAVAGNGDRARLFAESPPDIYASIIEYTDIMPTKQLRELGYNLVMIYETVYPPYIDRWRFIQNDSSTVFCVWTREDIIKITDPAYYRDIIMDGQVIQVPVMVAGRVSFLLDNLSCERYTYCRR